jgi:phosphatidylethanolamine N-methyltransferase
VAVVTSRQDGPDELNVWLCFRIAVDLILLNDFTSYCLFAWAWLSFDPNKSVAFHALRWITGWALIAFNVVVKVDAHRVCAAFCITSVSAQLVAV